MNDSTLTQRGMLSGTGAWNATTAAPSGRFHVRHGFPEPRGMLGSFETESEARACAQEKAERGYCVGVYNLVPIAAYGEAEG